MTARPEALVSPTWVAEHLADAGLRLLQVENDRAVYEAGHLPGAIYAGGYADFTEDRDGVRALIPLRETLEATLSRLGLTPEHRVVAYAASRSPWPARAYWVLRTYGFPSVHIVNGSLDVLRATGLPITTEAPVLVPATVRLQELDPSLLATVEDVLAVAQGGDDRVVDCRTDEEWRGEAGGHAPAPRLGRIPRAVHLNWERLVDEEGRFLGAEQLRSLYAAAGIDGSRPVYPYCGGGVRSAVSWFVLHELLGYQQARNYDGSWAEWSVRSELPIERG